jgi:2-polyprenyl-3-methyl-5-hydroxy-6-metoxy-1,4-benzoquinol methylase
MDSQQLKQAIRATWMAGDFGQIARYMEREAEAFVERLGIIPGMKVLDVACGTGNLAVPAARKGAQVVGQHKGPCTRRCSGPSSRHPPDRRRSA